MSFAKKAAMVLAIVVSISTGVWAQRMGRGMGQQPPRMPGQFKPVVGSGAQYEMKAKDHTMNFAYAVVGKEDVAGSPGYWMEIRTEMPEMQGETVMKQLMVMEGGKADIKRMITQAPGRPPMEMPVGMMSGMMKQGQQSSEAAKDEGAGEKVGTETVTVPAGTFVCEHYRKQQGKTPVDFWVSTQVSPYGVVKMTGADMTMVLKKILSNETSHIKGEPQKMNFEMPHF